MVICAAFSLVLPCAAILIQAFNRWRIGIAVVEILDLPCYIKRLRSVVGWSIHGKFSMQKIPRQYLCLPGNQSIKLLLKGRLVNIPLQVVGE